MRKSRFCVIEDDAKQTLSKLVMVVVHQLPCGDDEKWPLMQQMRSFHAILSEQYRFSRSLAVFPSILAISMSRGPPPNLSTGQGSSVIDSDALRVRLISGTS